MVQVAIMGYGVVGSGVAEILQTHKKSLEKNCLLYTSPSPRD